MRTSRPLLPLMAALALVATVPACAPANTGSTVSARGLGGAASVSYGTIVGSRPVQVQGGGTGIGTVGGAVAGGLAGSFIGGDWRSNALAGLGGALLGGIAGSAVDRGVTSGTAIEFVVREDRGGDIAVVQTNEEALQVGDRVVITRGDRVRLSRAAGAPPPGYAPAPGVAPQSGYVPQAGAVVSPVGGPAK
ncbi:glycine zipper 2TM domain-containing protein [Falsiroseomonas sp.]|uniref:glycine zipper 2TM domain-containing protein n=1 Tax=Falsiroseomonas sp. TaxID=2870721 RepID=UPI00356214E5